MPLYSYKAKDDKGAIVEDTIQAANKGDAATAITSRGLQLLTVKPLEGFGSKLMGGSISVAEKAAFCRFLATMLRSGMSLPETVDIISQENKNPKLKKILTDISYQTQKGKSISSVLANYKEDFDTIFLTMVKVGEESGTLEKSFDYLAIQLTASHELSQKISGSLMYPAVIVAAMLGNVLMMGLFVLPRIAGVFLKLDVPLPAYTKIVLSLGQFMGENRKGVLAATALASFLTVFIFWYRKTRTVIIQIISKMPIVKKVVLHIDIARFSRTLSTLLKNGVPIINALDVSADVLTTRSLKIEAKKFSKGVSQGESLSDVLLKNRKTFPAIMVQTIRAGEKSGNLEQVLEEMATFYESEVEYSLKRLTSLLEPLLMLFIGVAVAIMVIMMIAPIYSIIGGLNQTIET